jgi:hypothetical protein
LPNFDIKEAAELAEIKPAQLKLWCETGKFTPSTIAKRDIGFGVMEMSFYFTEADIQRLVKFAASGQTRKPSKETSFVDDGTLTDFTVAQIASMWQLSTDTIQRLFEDEPGVIALGNKNPRGKRKRVTLRIPRSVMERVKKLRSNPK